MRDIDVQLEEDGTYEIFIGDWEGEKPAKNCIRANGSRKGEDASFITRGIRFST